jgi:hypothetical protein
MTNASARISEQCSPPAFVRLTHFEIPLTCSTMSIRLPESPYDADNRRGNVPEEARSLLSPNDVAAPDGLASPFQALDPEQAIKLSETPRLQRVPVPKMQTFLLAFFRASQTLVYFCIFPFVNKQLVELGVAGVADVGFWSGSLVRYLSAKRSPY